MSLEYALNVYTLEHKLIELLSLYCDLAHQTRFESEMSQFYVDFWYHQALFLLRDLQEDIMKYHEKLYPVIIPNYVFWFTKCTLRYKSMLYQYKNNLVVKVHCV